MSSLNKAELRQTLLKTRQSLSIEEWREKSDRICSHLRSLLLTTSSQTILAYFSYRREPDLSPLFVDVKHCWGFPRCIGNALVWHIWSPGATRQPGAYGILEPHPDNPTIEPDEVDLILVPSVACDVRGYRLGYGGGYYDRLLSSIHWANKPTIGIVFEFAYLHQLPTDSWDRQLHSVCTEVGLKTIE